MTNKEVGAASLTSNAAPASLSVGAGVAGPDTALRADPDSEAMRLASLNGRDWNDMSEYEREDYRAEARKVECDCCGKRVPADEVTFMSAERAMAAQCDTVTCERCLQRAMGGRAMKPQKRTAKDFVLSQRPLCECRRHLGDQRWFIWDRARADRITGYAKSPAAAWKLAMERGALFRVSADYVEWAHGPGAESHSLDGADYSLAVELCELPANKRGQIEVPADRDDLLAEIESVAELYVGGDDTDLRAARVLSRVRAFRKAARS